MARKTKEIVIEAKNRDNGKKFKITEMPARQAEEWAIRVVCELMASGVELPDKAMDALKLTTIKKPENTEERQMYDAVMASGMIALAKFGVTALSKIPFERSKPLMDELLSCVKFVGGPGVEIPLTDEGQIEEAGTWFRLKKEALMLHVDFLTATAE